MAKLFAAKSYPALIDIYQSTSYQDPISGEIVTNWNYLEPDTMECTFVSLRPQDTLESFGSTYTDKEFLLIEVKPEERINLTLSMQAGNITEKGTDGEEYYVRTTGAPQVFNISGITPVTDITGSIVSIQLYLEQVGVNPNVGEIARGH